jgi:FkbM family methyltransferase
VITYAQNFEDVILARALGERRDGFYVDIGACFPDVASVTRHFYDLGWSGVNVEPMEEPYRRLCEQRPRDVNLRAAVGARTGEIEIFPGPTVGESSALRHDAHAEGVVVPCFTLAELCRRHAARAIDFLKIDVEGLELDVLSGGDWIAHRPRVIVVEVSEPWRTVRRPDAGRIDAVLRAAGYREVYYDGLNAFFVAHEAEALAPLLALPPNVLDGFASPREAQYDALTVERTRNAERADAAEKHADALGSRLDEALAGWRDEQQRTHEAQTALRDERHRAESLLVKLASEASRAEWAFARCDIFEKHAVAVEQQLAAVRGEAEQARRWGETAVADLERRLRDMHAHFEQSEARARRAEASFATIEASRSWRITAPLRTVGHAVRGFPAQARPHAAQSAALARRALRGAITRGKGTRTYARVAPLLKRRFPMAWLRGREVVARLTRTREVPPLPVESAIDASVVPPVSGGVSAQSIADMIVQEAARQRRA